MFITPTSIITGTTCWRKGDWARISWQQRSGISAAHHSQEPSYTSDISPLRGARRRSPEASPVGPWPWHTAGGCASARAAAPGSPSGRGPAGGCKPPTSQPVGQCLFMPRSGSSRVEFQWVSSFEADIFPPTQYREPRLTNCTSYLTAPSPLDCSSI